MMFSPILGDAPVALMLDALVVPIILASRASHASRIMQFLHLFFLSMPEIVCNGLHTFVGHIFGPHNGVTDAGSRGRLREMDEIMRHLGLDPIHLTVPERGIEFMDDLSAVWDSLSEEQRLRESAALEQLKEGDPPVKLDPIRGGRALPRAGLFGVLLAASQVSAKGCAVDYVAPLGGLLLGGNFAAHHVLGSLLGPTS